MIHSFSFKNFYSFNSEHEVSFVVDGNTPENNGYFVTPSGERISKALFVTGPNASGKTNVLKVVPFIVWLIMFSYDRRNDAAIPIEPFLLCKNKNNPISLSLTFEIDGAIYEYYISLTKEIILHESLFVTKFVSKRRGRRKLFVRQWNQHNKTYDISDASFHFSSSVKKRGRSNVSILSHAIRDGHKESLTILDFLRKIDFYVHKDGYDDDHQRNLRQAIEFYHDEINSSVKENVEKILKRYDIGVKAFDIVEKENEKGSYFNVSFLHTVNEESYSLPIYAESHGTQRLFVILSLIFRVLSEGGVVVLDEMDINLHPQIMEELLMLFLDPYTNPKNAQILLSSYSVTALNLFDKQQIVLTEKNEFGETEVWRLDEMGDDVRAGDNYFAKYLAGVYGGVPNIE